MPAQTVQHNHAHQRLGHNGCRCRRREDGSLGRNLVVCIDGTSNRFSEDLKFTNVIKLYNLTEKNTTQMTFYNSGIGTYARPSQYSWKHFKQVCHHMFNQAVAWNFEPIVLDAYRWLSDHYEVGDQIYLFGFSRGAYQVRVLSAMIDRVGLIHKGNNKQIPFAYELYAGLKDASPNGQTPFPPNSPTSPVGQAASDVVSKTEGPVKGPALQKISPPAAGGVPSDTTKPKPPPECVFKEAFCREVNVHFVGAWDTVSSIGLMRGESHPDSASGMKHVCYFRHALALDERRVKFLPEYVHGGATASHEEAGEGSHPHTKEVWFSGSHSDVGGATSQVDFPPSLIWMAMEAAHMGLRMRQFKPERSSDHRTKSLKGPWWLLEWAPVKHLAYKGKSMTTRMPHAGSGRNILEGQKIHASVLDIVAGSYTPIARLPGKYSWKNVEFWQQDKGHLIEPWGALGHMAKYEGAKGHQEQRNALEELRRSARTESGKRELLQAGVFHTLETLPGAHEGRIHREDLQTIRDIFDEVYDGRLPAKLAYKDLQPLLSHILVHGLRRDYEFAHTFLVDFTDLLPVDVRVFHKHDRDSPAIFASFLPGSGSDRVIAASEDGRIRIWNLKSGGRVFGFRQKEKLKSFACSPDGQHAVSTSYSGKIYVWDIATRALSWEGTCPRGTLGPVNFDPRGNLVISAFETTATDSSSKLRIWEAKPADLATHGIVDNPPHGASTEQHDMAIEEQALLNSSHLQFWDASRRQLGSELFKDGLSDLSCVAFSQDGHLAASGRGKQKKGQIRDASKKAIIDVYYRAKNEHSFAPLVTLIGDKGSAGSVKTLAFSPDGDHLISGGGDNRIRVWDTENWHEMINFEGHDGDVNAVAFSEVDERIVSCSDDGTVRIWDAKALLTGPNLGEHDYDSPNCPFHGEA